MQNSANKTVEQLNWCKAVKQSTNYQHQKHMHLDDFIIRQFFSPLLHIVSIPYIEMIDLK